jgi:folate-dependent tRNA-U54 methylase TrmFO/GidA
MYSTTFVAAPKVLLPFLQSHIRTDLFFAGQITSVDGDMGNKASLEGFLSKTGVLL